MINGNEAAFPHEKETVAYEGMSNERVPGLTKREYFIGQALASMTHFQTDPKQAAALAAQVADAILKELERTK
jgi:hypothetical protein